MFVFFFRTDPCEFQIAAVSGKDPRGSKNGCVGLRGNVGKRGELEGTVSLLLFA